MILDDTWIKTERLCDRKQVLTYVKRFEDFSEAEELCRKHFHKICAEQGAIFIGFTAPVVAYTPESSADSFVAEERSSKPKWYVEVFLIPTITFGDLLCFVDILEFGAADEDDVRLIVERRRNAKLLLTSIAKQTSFSFSEVAATHIVCRFLGPVDSMTLESVGNAAIAFNRKYFSIERPESEWKRRWRTSNTFLLGPG